MYKECERKRALSKMFFFFLNHVKWSYCHRFCVGFLWEWNNDNTKRFYCFMLSMHCGIIFATLEWWKATITNEWIHIVHISIHKQCMCGVFFSSAIYNEIRYSDENFCTEWESLLLLLFLMFLRTMNWTKAENWNNLIKYA